MKKKPRNFTYNDYLNMMKQNEELGETNMMDYISLIAILRDMPKKKKRQSDTKYNAEIEKWWQQNKHKYIDMNCEREYDV